MPSFLVFFALILFFHKLFSYNTSVFFGFFFLNLPNKLQAIINLDNTEGLLN